MIFTMLFIQEALINQHRQLSASFFPLITRNPST